MDQTGVHVPGGGEPKALEQPKPAFEFSLLGLENASEGSLEYPPLLEFLGEETFTKPLPLTGLPEGIFSLPPEAFESQSPTQDQDQEDNVGTGSGGCTQEERTKEGGGSTRPPPPTPIPDKYIWETYCQKPALPPDYYNHAESLLPPHPYLTHLARIGETTDASCFREHSPSFFRMAFY